MNTDNNEFDPSVQELEAKLAQWRVAPLAIDPKVVFYQSGFAAANSQYQTRQSNQRWLTAASLVIAVGLTSLLSYQAGRSAQNTDAKLADSKVINSAPEDSRLLVLKEPDESQPIPRKQTDWLMAVYNRWLQDGVSIPKLNAVSLSASKDPLRSLDQRLTMNFNNSVTGNLVDTQTLAGLAPTSSIDAIEAKPSLDWKDLLPKL